MISSSLAPVVFFVYNRPYHTIKAIDALKNNILADKTELFIYCDAPKEVEHVEQNHQVKSIIKGVDGFKQTKVIHRDKNFGLAKNIIEGVNEILSTYGKIIVLEDDLITSKYFLSYMNQMLAHYENEESIFSVSGYNHPSHLMQIPKDYEYDVYFSLRNGSWGWGTWAKPWFNTDWEIPDFNEFLGDDEKQKAFNRGGEDLTNMLVKQMRGDIDSWAIRWSYEHFKHNAYVVYPVHSYVDNIGMDGSGIHSGWINVYKNNLKKSHLNLTLPPDVILNNEILENFKKVYDKRLFGKLKKFISYLFRDFQ